MSLRVPVILLFIAAFLYRLFLTALRLRSVRNPIPVNVIDVYDEETHHRRRAYQTEKQRFALLSSSASFAAELLLLVLNAYAAFAGCFADTPFLQMFAVLLLSALASLVELPFSWYDTMVIEGKYGFNRTTPKTFLADRAREFLIGLLLMTLVGSLLLWAHRALGDWLVPAVAAAMTVFALLISFLFPVLSRIFNRFTPLEDGDLKRKLTALMEKHGYRVRAIRIMDASRRTTRSNAYFAGFGKMKTIVLYDTLMESMTPDEICAVFAHEMGHGLHRDTLKNQLLSFLQMAVLAVLAWLTLRTADLFLSFGFSGVNYGFAMLLILSVEFPVVSPLLGLAANLFSRKAEYRADAQAVAEGYGETLISALKKLARGNYAELAPSPLLVLLEASHPPLSRRIDAIRKAMDEPQP